MGKSNGVELDPSKKDNWRCNPKGEGNFTVALLRSYIDMEILFSNNANAKWNKGSCVRLI